AMLLPPLYIDSPPETDRVIRYFYHGTAAHEVEKRFLAEVVREVQQRDPRMLFEITGDSETRELFRGIERVVVLHPMDWPAYLAYSSSARQDIGLAPLFESPVNAARSCSKVYDITRTGAAGIYSDRAPYADFIRDDEDGVLLPDDAGQWAEAILDLAANPGRRRAMALAARARCPAGDDSFRDLFGVSRQDGFAQVADSGTSK
ncbi:MAG: glycosyltransferase, partial [Gammaproteobacteria bacterium]|nr:glycosyltransferase [Gammaproteobacteria bacterium]